MQTTPFKRAKAMMAAISVILSTSSGLVQQLKLDALGVYRSRGHGRGDPFARQNYTSHSKYKPHQGKKECARRVRQLGG
jgi:hypothetical protein